MSLTIKGDLIEASNGDQILLNQIWGWYEVTGYGTTFVLYLGQKRSSDFMTKETKITLSKYLDNPLSDFDEVICRKIKGGTQLLDHTSSRITACDRLSDEIPRIGEQHLHLFFGSYPIHKMKKIVINPENCVIEFEQGFFDSGNGNSTLTTIELSESLVERLKNLINLISFVEEGCKLIKKEKINELKEFKQRNFDLLVKLSKPQSSPKVEVTVDHTKSYQAQLFVARTLGSSLFENLVNHIIEKVGDANRCHFHLFKSPHSYHSGNLLWVSVEGMTPADHYRLLDGITGFESVAFQYEPHISPLMIANRVPLLPMCAKIFIQGEADADFGLLVERFKGRLGLSCRFLLFKPRKQPNKLVGKILYVIVEGVKQQLLHDVAMEFNNNFSVVDSSLEEIDSIVDFSENDNDLQMTKILKF